MADLHVWVGLIAGWLLFAIFITGAICFYREEVSQWLRPEIPARPAYLDNTSMSERALASLTRLAPTSSQWQIWLPTDRSNVVEVAWQAREGRDRALLDPTTGQPLHPRDTQAGDFFYYFHFSLHYLPRLLGRWIVGLCAMLGLLAIVTGVIVHKRIFRDFFTFRWGKGQRSWLDAHNALSVCGLPFHAMILYTGLVTLMFTYMPWGKDLAYPAQRNAAELREVMTVTTTPMPASEPRTGPIEIAPMIQEAARLWTDKEVHRIIVSNPGTSNAQVIISRGDNQRASVTPDYLVFDHASGSLLEHKKNVGAASRTWAVFYALHVGRFADGFARLLYFVLSLTGAAMVATGMVLWTVKRGQKHKSTPSLGLRCVKKANVAAMAGLLIAVPAFFITNRVLATDLPHRGDWEIHIFFLVWSLAVLHASTRRPSRAWTEQFLLAALLFASIPFVNAFMTSRGFLKSVAHHDWLFTAFDGAFIVLALVLCLTARRMWPRS